ncbi:hypothetical protein [Nocardiopsis tropica]|uniref:Uncharacterized protein n=1 Tax=Nocardiopsis tropica TaxID=109330 RepID=A0ABU7KN80_9ACTN|nr:hypothetical protein [Nocardiopsis umidischolae]MEE2050732.1 hypothetical protein [Nocardiopsis umidischolae]
MTASPPLPAPPADPGHERHDRATAVHWAALAWSAAALALGLGWLSGVLPVNVADEDGFGSLFAGRGEALPVVLVLAMGAVGAVCSVLMLRGGGPRAAQAGAWTLAVLLLLVFVDGNVLALFGYTMIMPVVGWIVPGLAQIWVLALLRPDSLTGLFFMAGVGVWVVAALVCRRAGRHSCVLCGRGPRWSAAVERGARARALRVGRIAVAVGAVTALVYPSVRIPWLFGVPVGMSREDFAAISADPFTLVIGVGLGSAGIVGAVLMLGLVQRWGVRFPRWTAGLAGRRVPVALAVVPATLVAVALVAMGRSTVTDSFAAGVGSMMSTSAVHVVVFASMGVWGAALGVATAAYLVRRRSECGRCGRGLPEAEPRDIRAAAA